MAPRTTIHDPFNAVAEPKRRKVLEVLAPGERSVNDIVKTLKWPQPMVSKHLGVLKKVGLVSERRVGRQHMYRVNPDQLKPIRDWINSFEQLRSESFDRLDELLQEIQKKESEHARKK
jgi:DNA-binding transcriptional ArsR family regulator